MMTHGVATGNRWLHLRAKTPALREKRLWQSEAAQIVMARCGQCHHGQPLFARLEADIGPIKMKTKLRIEPQARISTHDQHDLVERRHACGELGPIAEDAATVVHPTNPFGAERLCRVVGYDRLADPVNTRDADRTKSPLGLLELLA